MTKKIMALVLAAAITTGIGGFGTYAYFTDSDKVEDEVSITMGNLSVEAYWLNDWAATSNATEVYNEFSETLTFDNAKPGDTFERTLNIANYGTLKADIGVTYYPTIEGPNGQKLKVELVNIEGAQKDGNTEAPNRYYANAVAPGYNTAGDYIGGGGIKVTVKVTIPTDVNNEWMEEVIGADANLFLNIQSHQTIY